MAKILDAALQIKKTQIRFAPPTQIRQNRAGSRVEGFDFKTRNAQLKMIVDGRRGKLGVGTLDAVVRLVCLSARAFLIGSIISLSGANR